jgi:tape measure domain-containing protein
MATTSDTLLTILRMEGGEAYVASLTAAAQATHKVSQEEQAADRMRRSATEGINALSSSYSAQAARMTQHAMAAGVVSAGFLGIAGAAVKAAAAMEQSKIALATLTGSKAAGGKLFEELKTFAKETPFEFKDLPPLASRAMAYGFKPDEIVKTLTTVGDAASAVGIGTEGMNRIITSLGQMQARGKVTGEEMRELASAGIPAAKYLAAAFGVTTAEIGKMQEKGIDAGRAIPALLEGMKASFGGAMLAQMDSATGKLSNFKDAVGLLAVDMGNELLPMMKDLVATGTQVVGAFAGAPQSVKSVAMIGTVLVGVGAGIYGVVAAGKAWSYQTQVNVMQQALLTAELERQGIVLNQGAAGMDRRAAMMRTGMGIAGGAAAGAAIGGMVGDKIADIEDTGAGIAATGGTILAGAGAGFLMGGPAGAVVGGLSALAVVAFKATAAIQEMSDKASAAQFGAENKFRLTMVPTNSFRNNMDMAQAMGNAGYMGPGGTVAIPTQNIPTNIKDARERGWVLRDSETGKVRPGPSGLDQDPIRNWYDQQEWITFRAGLSPDRSTLQKSPKAAAAASATTASPAAQADALGDLTKSYAGLQGAEMAYVTAIDAEIAKRQELLAGVETDKQYKDDVEKQTARNTQLQAIQNLETQKAEIGTKALAKAEAERAQVLKKLNQAFSDMAGGASGYLSVLKSLGVDAMDPLMQQGNKYMKQMGRTQMDMEEAQGRTGSAQWYGGLQMQIEADKANLGPGAGGIRGVPGWDPQAILKPWQTAFAGMNAEVIAGTLGERSRIPVLALTGDVTRALVRVEGQRLQQLQGTLQAMGGGRSGPIGGDTGGGNIGGSGLGGGGADGAWGLPFPEYESVKAGRALRKDTFNPYNRPWRKKPGLKDERWNDIEDRPLSPYERERDRLGLHPGQELERMAYGQGKPYAGDALSQNAIAQAERARQTNLQANFWLQLPDGSTVKGNIARQEAMMGAGGG